MTLIRMIELTSSNNDSVHQVLKRSEQADGPREDKVVHSRAEKCCSQSTHQEDERPASRLTCFRRESADRGKHHGHKNKREATANDSNETHLIPFYEPFR